MTKRIKAHTDFFHSRWQQVQWLAAWCLRHHDSGIEYKLGHNFMERHQVPIWVLVHFLRHDDRAIQDGRCSQHVGNAPFGCGIFESANKLVDEEAHQR